MKKIYFSAILCFSILATGLAKTNANESKAKEPYAIQLNVLKSANSDFTPTITPILGMSIRTALNMTEGGSGYNFQPANVRVGLGGVKAQFTKTISALGTFTYHTGGKICDFMVEYKPCAYFGVQIGRVRGAGVKAAHEAGPFGIDLGDYPYISEALALTQGAADLRHLGVNVFGTYKWMKYAFFLHNRNPDLIKGMNSLTDEFEPNRGLEFKNWDASLSFNPLKQLEFGGHVGLIENPDLNKASRFAYSAFCYWAEPGNYRVKFDFGHYDHVNEAVITPKTGFSLLAGYFINPQFELLARFEHADHKNKKDEVLQLYTVGVAYYIPKLPNRNKITLFYQHRNEKLNAISNDQLAVQYQFVF